MKYCPGCDTYLPTERFGKNRSKPDGLQNYCKGCRASRAKGVDAKKIQAYQAEYRADNIQRLSAYSKERYEESPEYYKQKAQEWRNANPERKRELDRQWYLNNRERQHANNKRWAKDNPERRKEIVRLSYARANGREKARLRAASRRARQRKNLCIKYTQDDLDLKMVYWGGRCYLCGLTIESDLHWDHVKPISKDGSDIIANLRPTHAGCNKRKSASWPGTKHLEQLYESIR